MAVMMMMMAMMAMMAMMKMMTRTRKMGMNTEMPHADARMICNDVPVCVYLFICVHVCFGLVL